MKLLDLFCGVGGASEGYKRAGFEVVGVDIRPQPNYPFEFHQADALTFPLNGFDAVHASPPCQRFTALKTVWNYKGEGAHPDLLEPIRKRLVANGKPFVIENVPGAPMMNPIKLCGSSFGLGVEVSGEWRQLRRHRLFESSILLKGSSCDHASPTIGIYGDHARDRRRKPGVRDRGVDFPDSDKIRLGRAALDIAWAGKWKELSEAIPPAFTEYVGKALAETIRRERRRGPMIPPPPGPVKVLLEASDHSEKYPGLGTEIRLARALRITVEALAQMDGWLVRDALAGAAEEVGK